MKINQDAFLIIAIILIALIFFGIGRLTSPKSEPIQIMNLEKASVEDLKIPAEQGSDETYQGDYEGKVLGSKNSDKYNTRSQVAIMELNQFLFLL